MISHQDILDYMQAAVAASADIATDNFFRMDITEIQGQMRQGITGKAVVLESHEISYEGSSPSNSLVTKSFAFSVIAPTTTGNYDQQNTALDECEVIGTKFLQRMRYHSNDATSVLYKLFDVSNVRAHKVGPVFLNWYGYRFEIDLKPQKIDLKVKPADWSDIDDVCIN